MLKISYQNIVFRYVVFVSLSILVIFPPSEAIAQVSTAYVETEGTGNTQAEAIADALIEAVYRIHGVRINSDTHSSVFRSLSDDTLTTVTEIHKAIRLQTASDKKNELLGYEVISSRQDSVGLHAVTVQARYSKYRVPGPQNKRRTLAVLDFPVSSDGYIQARSTQVSDLLGSQLEALLIQSRRFSVLDRKRDDIYAREMRLLQSSDVDIAERARLGKVAGADYMVYGEILSIGVERIDKSIKISDQYKEQFVATVPVMFKVMAVATRQMKWSSTIVAEHIVENTNKDNIVGIDQIVGIALHKAAELIAEELTENIYPPKISKVLSASRFVLNRGGNTVQNGMLFEVFGVGENILDPDTGEPLGLLETSAGLARVIETKPKYSIAEMETGASISEGMVLRKYRGDVTGIQQGIPAKPGFKDADSDGLPDYLGLLRSGNQN